MIKIEDSILINRTAREVFSVITDFGNVTRWQPDLIEERRTPEGPLKVGTRIYQKRKVGGKEVESTSEIVELVPNLKVVLKSTPGTTPPTTYSYTLEAVDGSTSSSRVKMVSELDNGNSIAARLAAGGVQNRLTTEMIAQLKALKQTLESRNEQTDDTFRQGLAKTRQSFFGRLSQALGSTTITEETWDDLEALLLQADVGTDTTGKVISRLRDRYKREGMTRPEQLRTALKQELRALLRPPTPLNLSGRDLSVVLIVGVNGSGKTTTIGKLAKRLTLNNRKVMMAAGDTFRAAAIEQLQMWGQRADVPVIAGQAGADPGAVVFDAISAAKQRGYDVLLVDTAGRLQTKFNLMEELKKIEGVMSKVVPDAPHEVLIVLDGTTGQNALSQAKGFSEKVKLTGVIVTKLDGTAKGGMLFAIQQEMGLPIHYVGLGERVEDLVFFNPDAYVDSLFEEDGY